MRTFPFSPAAPVCLALCLLSVNMSIAQESRTALLEPGVMLREGTWNFGFGSFDVPQGLDQKTRKWPVSVGISNGGYEAVLLSSQAKPGMNAPTASLTSNGSNGC